MILRIGLAAVVLLAVAGCGAASGENVAVGAEPAASEVTVVSTPTVSSAPPTTAEAFAVPAGLTAGVAVYDRQAKAFTVQHNVEQRFRSASLIKLFFAIDYLWNRQTVPAADKQKLDIMLSRSDDNAASYFYNLGGRTAIIARMNQRLGTTVVPPTAPRTGWGSHEVSAAHLVRVYRYLLEEAPPNIGTYVLGRIRQGSFTRCGTDGYDQSFGIPTAFAGQPWAAKQGWYEFANAPKTCRSATPAGYTLAAAPVDWEGEALHTTGLVGAGDRTIVVLLTLHRSGTPYATATTTVTTLARGLPLTR